MKVLLVMFAAIAVLLTHATQLRPSTCEIAASAVVADCCLADVDDDREPGDAPAGEDCRDCPFCKAPATPSITLRASGAGVTVAGGQLHQVIEKTLISGACVLPVVPPPKV